MFLQGKFDCLLKIGLLNKLEVVALRHHLEVKRRINSGNCNGG